jgi:GH15 family glucan-1,4-alpha-glucosidase
MSRLIEEYAVIGDLHSAALVGRDGSIDWLCLPRFDSEACLAALLGDERHGHWRIAPADEVARVRRRYLPDTLVLETEFTTASGTVRLVDCMPPRDGDPVLVRLVEGVSGTVGMRMTLAARFEYGSALPRVDYQAGAHRIAAGSESLWLFSPVDWLFSPVAARSPQATVVAEFSVRPGDRVPVSAIWRPSQAPPPGRPIASALIERTTHWWHDWVRGLRYEGEWREAVIRSLITIKALTYAPTGGVLAAPTTSLPQQPSGLRNWDYRYCWIRDAAAALDAFTRTGADSEAISLWDWMSHVLGGTAAGAQPLYRAAGERLLPEITLDWLPGYEGAKPVRIGNAAARVPQLSVVGEVMRARLAVRAADLAPVAPAWEPDATVTLLESRWREPEAGIWEVRGPPRQFVHSKAMVWAAADSAVTLIERFGDRGPVSRWRRLRAAVHADVLERGYDAEQNTFVQSYGSTALDASLLRLPLIGFLPASDSRMAGTVDAVLRELDDSGVLPRYRAAAQASADGLPPGEGGYLTGSFWLAQCLALLGRVTQARRVFTGLLERRNDVGLLAEAYDPLRRRFAGNHPLAGCHIALIVTAARLSPHIPAQPARAHAM